MEEESRLISHSLLQEYEKNIDEVKESLKNKENYKLKILLIMRNLKKIDIKWYLKNLIEKDPDLDHNCLITYKSF